MFTVITPLFTAHSVAAGATSRIRCAMWLGCRAHRGASHCLTTGFHALTPTPCFQEAGARVQSLLISHNSDFASRYNSVCGERLGRTRPNPNTFAVTLTLKPGPEMALLNILEFPDPRLRTQALRSVRLIREYKRWSTTCLTRCTQRRGLGLRPVKSMFTNASS